MWKAGAERMLPGTFVAVFDHREHHPVLIRRGVHVGASIEDLKHPTVIQLHDLEPVTVTEDPFQLGGQVERGCATDVTKELPSTTGADYFSESSATHVCPRP